jgi:hypothetical protein
MHNPPLMVRVEKGSPRLARRVTVCDSDMLSACPARFAHQLQLT